MITTPNMGLKLWNLQSDPYNSSQLAENFAKIENHDHSNGRGIQINGSSGIVDGSITPAKLAAGVTATPLDGSVTTPKIVNSAVTADKLADAAKLGLTDSTYVRRGTTGLITATETTTSATFTTLTTPDTVTGIVLPTNGLIAVCYQATWQETVNVSGQAAIFIGSNQLTVLDTEGGSPGPVVQAAGMPAAASSNRDSALFTCGMGLVAAAPQTAGVSAPLTTGQIVGGVGPGTGGNISMMLGGGTGRTWSTGASGQLTGAGGPCFIYASAGTYDVSVQFRNTSSGTTTAKNRQLWVWTIGF